MKFLAPPLAGLKIRAPANRAENDIAERRAKNAEIEECERLAKVTGQPFDRNAPDVREMTAAQLSWTTHFLKKLKIMQDYPGPKYIDGI